MHARTLMRPIMLHSITYVRTYTLLCARMYAYIVGVCVCVCVCSRARRVCVCVVYIIKSITLILPIPCEWPLCSLMSTRTLQQLRETEAPVFFRGTIHTRVSCFIAQRSQLSLRAIYCTLYLHLTNTIIIYNETCFNMLNM